MTFGNAEEASFLFAFLISRTQPYRLISSSSLPGFTSPRAPTISSRPPKPTLAHLRNGVGAGFTHSYGA